MLNPVPAESDPSGKYSGPLWPQVAARRQTIEINDQLNIMAIDLIDVGAY
ncbi:MAG: hypothetical protein CM15mP68_6490 [Pseudomonadota bacterium]|nr:MAG: hypothetical protein CM15mP68_6490 [Pseudomonadota bacterium]